MSLEFGGEISLLYADEEAERADVGAEVLEREDSRFTIETVTHVSDGINYLSENDLDCIVSECSLQGRSGIEFLDAVREEDSDLPFILFTGKGSEEVASDAISAGVTDYVQRDQEDDQYVVLANRIRNAVKQARIQSDRQRYLNALETAKSGISILDEERCYLYVNEAYADRYGYDPKEMVGENWERTYRADDQQKIDEIRSEVEKSGYWSGTLTGLHANGDTFIERLAVVTTEHGELVCSVQEREDQSGPEREFEQVKQRYRAVFDDPNILVGLVSTDGTLLKVNQTALEYVDTTEEAVTGELLWETPWWNDETQSLIRQGIDQAANGEYVEYSTDHTMPDGRSFFVTGTIRPVFDESGQVTSLIVSAHDITEQREHEQAIDALHSTTRELIMASSEHEVADLIVQTAVDILDLSHIGVHLYKEDRDALVPVAWSESIMETIGEPPILDTDSLAWQVFEEGEMREYSDLSAHEDVFNPNTSLGSELIVPLGRYGVAIIAATDQNAFERNEHQVVDLLCRNAAVALDRVDREQVLRERERELEQSNVLLSTLFETLPVGVLAEDTSRNVLAANQRIFELFQLPGTPESIVGADCEHLATEVSDLFVDSAEFIDRVNDLVAKHDSVDSEELRLRDGRTFTRSYRPIELTDGDGHLWVYHDITERKQRERELEQQNEQLDEFAGIVSHDLRNPLNIAQSYLELARAECDTDSNHLDDVRDALDRIHQIVEQTLLLARHGQAIGPTRSVDLAGLVTQCWESVDTAAADLEVVDPPVIDADPKSLRHLFENLFRNAVEHGGPDVTVRIGSLDDGFYVEDDGVGFPDDMSDDIFGPTPAMGGKTASLGLTIVSRIVEAHEWSIKATDGTDGGVRFEIAI